MTTAARGPTRSFLSHKLEALLPLLPLPHRPAQLPASLREPRDLGKKNPRSRGFWGRLSNPYCQCGRRSSTVSGMLPPRSTQSRAKLPLKPLGHLIPALWSSSDLEPTDSLPEKACLDSQQSDIKVSLHFLPFCVKPTSAEGRTASLQAGYLKGKP